MAFLHCAIFVVIVTISGLEPQIFDASLPGSLVSFSKVADILEAAVHNLQIPKGETHRKPKFCCWPWVTTLQFRLTNFTEFYCTTTVVGVLLIFFLLSFCIFRMQFYKGIRTAIHQMEQSKSYLGPEGEKCPGPPEGEWQRHHTEHQRHH